jgi:O-antigen ligase
MAYFYAVFIAGYFLLPMASGHRRVYYFLVLPAVLLLWRELARFYRHNALAGLLLAYATYMMITLLWTADFQPTLAAETLWYCVCVLSFCFISGYLWVSQAERMDRFAHRATWLAAAAALVSIFAWYMDNPFPSARLQPLGVMHHENKAACAYGLFFMLCMHYTFTERGRQHRWVYTLLALALLSLVLFSQSRTALAAVCVGLLVLIGYRALAIVALGAVASWVLLATNPDDWVHRVTTFSFRPGIWEQVLHDMQGHWWLGHGYLIDPQVAAYDKVFSHAHNSYLATLRDGGLMGLGLLLAVLALAGRWAWQLSRLRGERIYLALLLYGMTCIAMDYDRLFVHPKEIWLFFWLPVALIMAVYPGHHAPATTRYPGPKP